MSEANSRTRGLPWLLSIGAAAMLGLALVLMFLLALATNNQTRFEQYFERLLYVNIAVATLLLLGLLWVSYRLISRLRRGRFGSRLLLKLAAIFALVGFLPGVLIYGVSYQFVSRSIESWFNVQVEGALDAGLALGRNTIDAQANDLLVKTRAAAQQIAESEFSGPLTMERIREQLGASDVILWSGSGQVIASAGESRYTLAPEKPSATQLRQVRSTRGLSVVEGLEDSAGGAGSTNANTTPRARVKAMAALSGANLSLSINSALSGEPRVLQVTQILPAGLVANALAVQEAYRQYQERALARNGLRNMYIGTLTLSLFLAMFGAVLLAIVLGNQIVRPLLVLADGVAQVAAGDLTPKAALQTRDELGGLTRSFAQMTHQLSDARAQVHSSLMALDASRTNLQTILDNLTAGVIVLDAQGIVLQANPGATRVLRSPLAVYVGKPLAAVPGLEAFASQVSEQFHAFFGEQEAHSAEHWQQSFELAAPGGSVLEDAALRMPGQDSATSVIARGAALPGGQRLLVFDDITEIVSAQRARAWGEVARRLAHEIKNPLTPIQLSAERLEMKLQGKLAGGDDALLTKSVKTIVDQVDAMKRLVNEFRDYARLPSADLKPLQLGELIADVLALYAPENATVPVIPEIDPHCPRIKGDAQQLRQVIHNLLQNAQDATLAQHEADLLSIETDSHQPCVRVTLRYNVATQRVRLRISDEGAGFAPHILQRAFEPYVTTKVKGTGLGLAVVKKIADEHGARVELANRVESSSDSILPEDPEKTPSTFVVGAQVSLYFPVV